MLIGLVADTHGLVRPEALAALDGVDSILHAGDVGGEQVLAAFRRVAPVSAVAGNTDDPDAGLPAALDLTIEGLSVHVSHGHEVGAPTPDRLVVRYHADVIVFGHTHRPIVHHAGHRLVVNPGAAGPRRFNLKPSIGLLRIVDGVASVEIVFL
jgi:putative phosphoesterase